MPVHAPHPLQRRLDGRAKANSFAEMIAGSGSEPAPVTLPHDAMIGTERSPAGHAATAYFPSGNWEYKKSFEPSTDDAGSARLPGVRGRLPRRTGAGERHAGRPPARRLLGLHRPDRPPAAFRRAQRGQGRGARPRRQPVVLGGRHLPQRLAAPGRTGPPGAGRPAGGHARDRRRRGGRWRSAPRCGTSRSGRRAPCCAWRCSTRTGTSSPEPRRRSRRCQATSSRLGSGSACRRRTDGVPTIRTSTPAGRPCWTAIDVLDEESTTFGIRSLTVDPVRGLRINGEPVLLRGACVHHDNGPLGAATIGRAEERRVELLKEAGFNAIRSAHNPLSKPMLDACDRLGVLVMDETFDMWTQPKSEHDYALRFPDWWEADVEAMVRKDFNHPSVILYSIGNEIPEAGTPMGARVGRALAEKIRSLDGTRFVTEAISGLLVGGSELFAQLAEGRRERDRGAGRGDGREHGDDPDRRPAQRPHDVRPSWPGTRPRPPPTSMSSGYNYMETRFATDGELYPNRVIVGSETHPAAIDTGWAAVRRYPLRHRRLHLDRLGLPRRGRDRAHRLRPAGRDARARSRSSASTRGGPPGAATSTSPATAARSRTTARSSSGCGLTPTSPCSGRSTTARSPPARRGPGATSCRAGAGPGTRARR